MRVTLTRLLTHMLPAALVVSWVAGTSSAQDSDAGKLVARKVDEYGKLYGCSGGARLDNFAIELQNEPDAKGYIVAHDAGNRLRGTAHAWGAYSLSYLVEMRGIEESRLVLLDAAEVSGDDLKMELWLAPAGAEPPAFKPPGKKQARPFGGKYVQLSVYSDTTFYDVDGPDPGSFRDEFIYAAYAELLKKQTDSQGYLVVYSPPGAAPGYWRRAGTREQMKLAGDGLNADRLTVINGGPAPVKKKVPKAEDGMEEETYGRVDLWVGAKEKPPVKHVEEDATLREAVLLGTNSFMWEEKEVTDWMLRNLAETMREDKRNVGCIVVYPGDGSGVPTGEHGADQPAPDVLKIAEAWKAALKKHGFDEQRVVVLSGPQEDSGMGRLEVWAVPYGAALPDPFKSTGEAGEEQAEDGGSEQSPPPPVDKEE